ncbi:MAG: glutamine synthetase III, partial [Candidatus Adiutrix sp.]|nr:glutamine synthetase III [Candidatus Adiutrix sp.]
MTHSASPRLEALALVSSGHRQPQADDSGKSIFETYGEDVFSLKLMRERLPREVCDRLSHIGQHGRAWEHYDADVVACAMKDWALSRGATHYTHWFQPMT